MDRTNLGDYMDAETMEEPPLDKPPSVGMADSATSVPAAGPMAGRIKGSKESLGRMWNLHPIGNALPSGFLAVFMDIREG